MSDGVGNFEHVFRRHHGLVWRSLARHGVRPADLADACQDVFLVVHRRLPEFEGRAALQTWLYRIARRVAADYRKRAHRRHEQPVGDAPVVACTIAPDAWLEADQLARALDAALGALSPPKRAAFVLHDIEQLSMEQVAEALACPLKTAYSRLHAARDGVRASLRRAGVASAVLAALQTRVAAAQAAPDGLARALAQLGAAGPTPAQTARLWSALSKLGPTALGLTPTGLWTPGGGLALCGLALLCMTQVVPPPAPPGAMLTRADPVTQSVPRRGALPTQLARARPPALQAEPLAPPARRARAALAPAPAPAPQLSVAPEPPAASAWLEPSPEPVPARDTVRSSRAIDLDEVLAATDPRPLMRVAGSGSVLAPSLRAAPSGPRAELSAPDTHH